MLRGHQSSGTRYHAQNDRSQLENIDGIGLLQLLSLIMCLNLIQSIFTMT